MELTLSVKGSSGSFYEVKFLKDGLALHSSCSCTAGSFGRLCKHRLSLLSGEDNLLAEVSKGHVLDDIAEMLKGTEVEVELARYFELVDRKNEVDASLKKSKKVLEKLLCR